MDDKQLLACKVAHDVDLDGAQGLVPIVELGTDVARIFLLVPRRRHVNLMDVLASSGGRGLTG